MENLNFDLTTQTGLLNINKQLRDLERRSNLGITIDFDIEGLLKDLLAQVLSPIHKIIDLFDDTKKLEKQMELAIKTIEVCKAAGAKSIDITISSKNEGRLKLHLKQINAVIGGEYKKDNSITYGIKF